MKRDMDLARKILFAIEESEGECGPDDIKIEGYSDQIVYYHIKILAEAGLIEAEDISTMGENGFQWWAKSLTWQGHEFLDAARDNSRWDKAKKLVSEKVGSLMFEALKIALTQGIKNQLFPGK